jgi:hypothetical protein
LVDSVLGWARRDLPQCRELVERQSYGPEKTSSRVIARCPMISGVSLGITLEVPAKA